MQAYLNGSFRIAVTSLLLFFLLLQCLQTFPEGGQVSCRSQAHLKKKKKLKVENIFFCCLVFVSFSVRSYGIGQNFSKAGKLSDLQISS